jgi:LAO/AO transport system kinase
VNPAPPRDPDALMDGAARGGRAALARLLSMVEGGGPAARAVARLAYRAAVPYTVGLTGAPGAGKSTLTAGLIGAARGGWPVAEGADGDPEPIDQVGVLAVDPSSPLSGGALLGDRVRMQDHATDPAVFIRSMATRGHLGGLALAVPDAVRVLGAAGLPVVLLETVGVGQMEVDVAGAADTTVVVLTPGWGDSTQAAKAGLLEVADLFVINKADRPGVAETRRDLTEMLGLTERAWVPPILSTSADRAEGIDELWVAVGDHRRFLAETGELDRRRASRLATELRRVLAARMAREVDRVAAGAAFAAEAGALVERRTDPYDAADRLLGPDPG